MRIIFHCMCCIVNNVAVFFVSVPSNLRIWNEVATIFLFAIVFLATVKQGMSVAYGLAGMASLTIVLMLAIRMYKKVRSK